MTKTLSSFFTAISKSSSVFPNVPGFQRTSLALCGVANFIMLSRAVPSEILPNSSLNKPSSALLKTKAVVLLFVLFPSCRTESFPVSAIATKAASNVHNPNYFIPVNMQKLSSTQKLLSGHQHYQMLLTVVPPAGFY